MATSASSHSRVKTESTLPPLSTTSAGRSPLATAIHSASMRGEHSVPATPGSRTVFDEREKAHSGRRRAHHRGGLGAQLHAAQGLPLPVRPPPLHLAAVPGDADPRLDRRSGGPLPP